MYVFELTKRNSVDDSSAITRTPIKLLVQNDSFEYIPCDYFYRPRRHPRDTGAYYFVNAVEKVYKLDDFIEVTTMVVKEKFGNYYNPYWIAPKLMDEKNMSYKYILYTGYEKKRLPRKYINLKLFRIPLPRVYSHEYTFTGYNLK